MSDTCRLFPLFGDPWLSCLLPSQMDSASWWWTGRPGVLHFMGSQRVEHDWVTELNWTELNWIVCIICMLCKICLCDQWNIADVMACPSSDQIIKDSANFVLVIPTVSWITCSGRSYVVSTLLERAASSGTGASWPQAHQWSWKQTSQVQSRLQSQQLQLMKRLQPQWDPGLEMLLPNSKPSKCSKFFY